MHSLVSSAVLAADLVRHPYPVGLLDTVDRVLALTPEEASRLGAPAPAHVRRQALQAAEGAPRVTEVLAGAEAEPAVLATRLDGALLGRLEDLHALLVREEPLRSLPPDAQQVALDAVTAAWVGPALALPASRALAAPWGTALHPVPAPLPERPWSLELRALLDEVPRRTAAQWRAATAREVRAPGWSGAMHEAARCAWAAGRLTDVARAQLVAARALVLAHTGVSPYAAARVLTAAVQAVCTRDLLPAEAHAVLVGPWEAGRAAG